MTPVQRLARVAHPVSSQQKWLAMIAYFDESGKPEDKPVVTLAALVSTELKWRRFEVSWMKILREYGAPIHPVLQLPYFHMTDYESGKVAPYNTWKRQKRIEFISKLASIIKRDIVFGCSHALVIKDWDDTLPSYVPTQFRKKQGWYIFLLRSVLEDIAKFVPAMKHEDIACIFDTNKEAAPAAKSFYEALKIHKGWERRFGSATYGNSVQLSPLQAADILAFEGRRVVHNKVINNEARPVSKLLISLCEKRQITLARYSREVLLQYGEKWREFVDSMRAQQRMEGN